MLSTFKIFRRGRNHGKNFLKLSQTSFSVIVHCIDTTGHNFKTKDFNHNRRRSFSKDEQLSFSQFRWNFKCSCLKMKGRFASCSVWIQIKSDLHNHRISSDRSLDVCLIQEKGIMHRIAKPSNVRARSVNQSAEMHPSIHG